MLAVFRRGTFSFRIKPHQKPPQATQEQSPPPDCHTTTATARRQPIQVDEPHPSCSTRTSCLLSISSDAFLEEYTSSINTCCIESMNSGRTQRGGNKLMDPAVDNPFESRGILNKKHDVFNRRVKGEKRNVARARGQATQRREKTLLVDYERNQKANSFRDKRFGEDDDALLLEEKMWARMQKDRNKRSRNGGVFNLGDGHGPTEVLTHRGQALGSNVEDGGAEDDGDDLNAEVVDQLHFGGDGARDISPSHPQEEKTRQEILNDIISRSKERKLEKARGKEEQESERERLDDEMEELLGMLHQRPPKGVGRAAQSRSDDYDLAMRELVFEARAQATDRLQTPEETARAEKSKLEKLEKARIERMSIQVKDGGTGGASTQSGRRKRKGRNDDELSGEERELSSTGAIEEQEDDIDGGNSISESDINDNAFTEDDEESEWASGSESEGGEARPLALAMQGKEQGVQKAEARELPYVFACPSSYEDLLAILAEHATSADDINTILDRIHKNHSIKLDSRNKERMHNFYDVLLKRFRRVGSQKGKLSPAERRDREKQLDFLSGLIYDITAEMPEVAASLWHRFCGFLHQRMVNAMADLRLGTAASGYWPSTGSLLLLKLLVQIFPSTDFRHPVVTPILLHLSQCLSQCPVKTSADLTAGLFSCSLLLHCCLGATRFSPEVMVFLSSALAQFSPSASAQQATLSPAFKNSPLGWMRAAAGSYTGEDLPAFSIGLNEASRQGDCHEFAAASLGAIYQLLIQVATTFRGDVAFPELFGPLQVVASKVELETCPSLPLAVQKLHLHLAQLLAEATRKCLSSRTPLQWRAVEPPALSALAPKFQERYKMKKDGHKDAEETKFKQLQRQVKRERKGAMRELKRDAAFLEHVKADKTAEKERTRKRRLRDNLTWLEEQQATINQQVKLGGKLVKGGGSSSTKRARVGRGY
ncbi:unnamed protein product [Pylaiella littoralis]